MRRRLVLVTLATTSMIALAFVLPLAVLVRDVAEERAMTRGRQVVNVLAPVLLTGDEQALEVALSGVDPALRTGVALPSGELVGDPFLFQLDLTSAFGGAATVLRLADADVLVTPVIRPDAGTSVVAVAVPDELQQRGVVGAWVGLGALAALLVAGAVALADRLGRDVTGPAGRVVDTARRLAGGDLSARAEPDGPPEVADIALALNRLADRIAALVRAEREAVADIGHRLRTPMTALRLDVDALPPSDARARLASDLEALERSVDRVIRDARAGADDAGAAARCDVVEVVRERCDWWAALAEDQDRSAVCELPPEPAWVGVTARELVDALDAVIGNVFAHTDEGVGYRVCVRVTGHVIEIEVSDDGPGFGDAPLTRGASRSSTGLGLDIASRVAERGGGSLRTDRAADGARVVLSLPPAAAPDLPFPPERARGTP